MSSSFPIQAVAERTGLSPHVIRAWERRYGAIEPARSPGKHRLYSEAEIERLAMLDRAVRKGHSIGRIARMPVDQLRELIAKPTGSGRTTEAPPAGDAATPFQADALAACATFDAPKLEQTLHSALLSLGHQGLLRVVVAPLAQEIGARWRRGELTAAHEHFFTANIKVMLGHWTRQFAAPHNAPRIVVATPVGQLHELGAVMAAASAANLGWHPIYLGPSLPAEEIAGAAISNHARAVALSIVYPEDDPDLPLELMNLARLLPTEARILAGGRAANAYFETLVRIRALYSEGLEEFGAHLDALRSTSAR